MKSVSAFEADLLRILSCLLGRLPLADVLPLLVRTRPRPKCLSRHCVELVQQMLASGCTEWLARSGWRTERFLVNGTITTGRVWQRHSDDRLSLQFSRHVVEFLMWLTAEDFTQTPPPERTATGDSAVGDDLFDLMAFSAVHDTLGAPRLLKHATFRKHPLIALIYPDLLAEHLCDVDVDFSKWMQADRVWLLELLQRRLTGCWWKIESSKRQSHDVDQIRRLGSLQQQVLDRFLSSVEQHNRRDVARFLLQTGSKLLASEPVGRWLPALRLPGLRLADRQAFYQSALVFFAQFERLNAWHQAARAVSYYDDDYQSSQLWKSDWEQFDGDRLYDQARRIISDYSLV
ncbi:MAG: hypothetical protein R3C49_04585 [Planctomycetaceae bacterium]